MAKGKKPAKIATKAEFARRVAQCLVWVRDGWHRIDAIREGSQLWGVTTRQCDDYFSIALKKVKLHYEKNQESLLSQIDYKLDHIYKDAITEKVKGYSQSGEPYYGNDLTNARQALMDKAKLAGLLKNQIEVSGQLKTGMEGLTDDEFDKTFTATDS